LAYHARQINAGVTDLLFRRVLHRSTLFTFDWDEGNLKYIARHGVSKEEAEEAFNSETLEL
jgi:hypothetical protein